MTNAINQPKTVLEMKQEMRDLSPKTQFSYALMFLAAPFFVALYAVLSTLINPLSSPNTLILYGAVLIPCLFAGTSFWLLSQNGDYKNATFLSIVTFIIVALFSYNLGVHLLNALFVATVPAAPTEGDRFFGAFDSLYLSLGLLLSLITTAAVAYSINRTPKKNYTRLGSAILFANLFALIVPIAKTLHFFSSYQLSSF